jgi:dTMP kinase
MQRNGLLIAFEGIDLCGKSTQAKMLFERLRGHWSVFLTTKEPGSPHDEITKQIRQILLDKKNHKMDPRCELALFFADRAQHIKYVVLQ